MLRFVWLSSILLGVLSCKTAVMMNWFYFFAWFAGLGSIALQSRIALMSWRAVTAQGSFPKQQHNWLLLALALQFVASQLLFWQSEPAALSALNALAGISLLIATLLAINARYRPFHGLYPWVLGLNICLLIVALSFPHWLLAQGKWSWLLASHVILALTSYSLISMAGIMALVLLLQTKQFRRHRISNTIFSLPPLQWVEKLHFELLLIGFICLTLAMSLGLVNQQLNGDTVYPYWQKSLSSLFSWLLLAATLMGHLLAGWRGPMAAKLTLTSLAVLSAGYLLGKLWLY